MGINSGRVTLKELKLNKFTARGILAMNQPGWYADPGTRGLYLRVFEGADGPSRSWLYRFTSPVSGKRRAMGLGSVEICSLANARQKSLGLRRDIFDGIDPIDQRQEKKLGAMESDLNSITFQEAAKRCIKTKEAEWSNSKHKDQWVEAAYRRQDQLEKRVCLMSDWEGFIEQRMENLSSKEVSL